MASPVIVVMLQTMAINGGCSTAADAIAQYLEISFSKKTSERVQELRPEGEAPAVQQYDGMRTVRFTLVGFFWGGITTWCRFTFLLVTFPSRTLSYAVVKALVNQLIFGPIIHAGVFYWDSYIQHGHSARAWKKMKEVLFWSTIAQWITKIPINILCFMFLQSVPVFTLTMRGLDIAYYAFLSHIASSEIVEKKARILTGQEDEETNTGSDKKAPQAPDKRDFKSARPCACCVVS